MSRLYIAEKAGIHVFDMDLKSGALTAIAERVDTDACGSFLALNPNGKFLYSIAKPGAAAFAIDEASGAITHINSVKCDIGGNAHASMVSDGGLGVLVLAAYGSGGVNVARILPDGSLAVVPGTSKQHKGGSNVYQPGSGNEQEAAHPHSCFIDPSRKWALVSDLGQDKVYVYAIDIEAGTLTEQSVVQTAPGAGPRHMCFHPKGQWVYGLNELDCTVNVYEFSPQGVVLGKISQTISTLPDGYNNRDHTNAKNAAGAPASGPNRPEQTNATADIHLTPDGRFLYASNRGHDSLVCYSVGTDGKLALKGFTYTRGEHPRNFSIHPSGRWLLAANQDSNNVVVFQLDRETGELTFSGTEITIKVPRCIKWAAQTENLITEESTLARGGKDSTGCFCC